MPDLILVFDESLKEMFSGIIRIRPSLIDSTVLCLQESNASNMIASIERILWIWIFIGFLNPVFNHEKEALLFLPDLVLKILLLNF